MTLHVEPCMGTVFSIDIRDPGPWADTIDDVVRWLHFVDATFSTYREDSDISRIRRGELRVADANPYVEEVLDLCAYVHRETGGYLTALPHGQLDPTGLVKGWAIERASALLRRLGSVHHAINGGGDIQLAGRAASDRPWSAHREPTHRPPRGRTGRRHRRRPVVDQRRRVCNRRRRHGTVCDQLGRVRRRLRSTHHRRRRHHAGHIRLAELDHRVRLTAHSQRHPRRCRSRRTNVTP